MPNILTTEKKTRVVNSTAAGITAVNSSSVDMQDYESVEFTCALGALTATQVTNLQAQGSPDNATWTNITGALTPNAADADSNKLLVLEVYRPQQRYVRCVVNRGTANAAIDSVVATQRGAKKQSTTQDATTVSQSLTVVGV